MVEDIWRQSEDLGDHESHAIDVSEAAPDADVRELSDGLGSRFLLSP